jgi:hypothetical protein
MNISARDNNELERVSHFDFQKIFQAVMVWKEMLLFGKLLHL